MSMTKAELKSLIQETLKESLKSLDKAPTAASKHDHEADMSHWTAESIHAMGKSNCANCQKEYGNLKDGFLTAAEQALNTKLAAGKENLRKEHYADFLKDAKSIKALKSKLNEDRKDKSHECVSCGVGVDVEEKDCPWCGSKRARRKRK